MLMHCEHHNVFCLSGCLHNLQSVKEQMEMFSSAQHLRNPPQNRLLPWGWAERFSTITDAVENKLHDLSSHLPAFSSHKHPETVSFFHQGWNIPLYKDHKKTFQITPVDMFPPHSFVRNCGTNEILFKNLKTFKGFYLQSLYLTLQEHEAIYLSWTANSTVVKGEKFIVLKNSRGDYLYIST